MHTAIKVKLETVFNEKQAAVLAEVIEDAYSELVKTSDFNELKEIVRELGQKVDNLAESQAELAESQAELAESQAELAESQAELAEAQAELAEAQKGSEQRLTRLEIIVAELAESQKKTQEELRELVQEHKKTRKQVGGLSTTVGYVLENKAYKALPELLKRDYQLIVKDRIKRKYIKDNQNKYIEVNIFGEATKAGKDIIILGEGKSQLSKNGVNEFIRKKLKRFDGVYEEIFPILITHMISEPDVEEYAKNKGIALYYSYDF